MRLAVFSDVHGNAPALSAVLQDIDRRAPDLILNLGDVASGAVDPRGTLDLLLDRPEILTVGGNHERQLLTLPPQEMGGVDRIADAVLTARDRAWLARAADRLEPVPGTLAFHGAPGDDLRYLLETVTESGLREATEQEIVERLGDEAARHELYLCGHTHLARTRRLVDGRLVVNPGSVGWPAFSDDTPYPHVVQAGSPEARYATLERRPDGWAVTHHRVDYDVEAAAALAQRHMRPDIARALRTGTV